jgi:hypothetical protein
MSIALPEPEQGHIAHPAGGISLPKGDQHTMRLADQIRKGLEASGVPTGKKLEQQPNTFVVEGRKMDTGAEPETKSTPYGTLDDVVVISPFDEGPREAPLSAMPTWMKEQGAVVGRKPKAA